MQSSAINLTPRDLVSGAYRPPSGSPWHVQAFGGVWSRPQLAERALHSLGRQLRSQTHRDQVSLVNKPLPILGQQLAGSQLLEMPPSATIHTAANPSSTIKSENLRTPANRRCRGALGALAHLYTGEGCHCQGPPSLLARLHWSRHGHSVGVHLDFFSFFCSVFSFFVPLWPP